MTLFITVHKRQSPGAAGILRLSCGQTCQSSGSASRQGRLLFSAGLPQACPLGSGGRRRAGRYSEQQWPGPLWEQPRLPCPARPGPALPVRKGRHTILLSLQILRGNLPSKGCEWRWPELTLLGLSPQPGLGRDRCGTVEQD